MKYNFAIKPKRKILSVRNFLPINDNENESKHSFATPEFMYNIHIDNGVLKKGLGVVPAKASIENNYSSSYSIPKFPIKYWQQVLFYQCKNGTGKPDKLIARNANGQMYKLNLGEVNAKWELIKGLEFDGKISAVNYCYNNKNVLLMCTSYNPLAIYDGTEYFNVMNAPKIKKMCIHYNRIFATTYSNKNEIWFSDDFNPENWHVSLNEAGYINFNDNGGKILDVKSLDDYVYIFREYSIYRLTAFGNQKNFSVVKITNTIGRIYESTIQECMGKIIFATDQGLFVFNGYKLTQICKNLSFTKNMTEYELVSESFNNHYFLAFDHTFKNKIYDENLDVFNNLILDFDFENNLYEITRGISICDFLTVNSGKTSKCYAIVSNKNNGQLAMLGFNGKNFDKDLMFYWKSKKTYFGDSAKFKYLRTISLMSEGDIKLTIVADDINYFYNIKGSKYIQEIKINKKAKQFQLMIEGTNKDFIISNLEMIIDKV